MPESHQVAIPRNHHDSKTHGSKPRQLEIKRGAINEPSLATIERGWRPPDPLEPLVLVGIVSHSYGKQRPGAQGPFSVRERVRVEELVVARRSRCPPFRRGDGRTAVAMLKLAPLIDDVPAGNRRFSRLRPLAPGDGRREIPGVVGSR